MLNFALLFLNYGILLVTIGLFVLLAVTADGFATERNLRNILDQQSMVIIAAAFILHALIFGLEAGRRLVPAWANLAMLALGVIIYGGVGVAGLMLDGLFLDYNVLSYDASKGQHYGIILVEFGVGLTVTGVMLALFHAFAGFVEADYSATEDDG